MKHIFSLLLLCAILLPSCTEKVKQIPIADKSIYQNDSYHFKVKVPEGWKLYREIRNDSLHNKAIVDWGLPGIYSHIEKTTIENSVSIRAIRRSDISSVEELIRDEYLSINAAETALEADSSDVHARIVYSTIHGLAYKGKEFFVYRNAIGYVITFMATPGTFDKNIGVFNQFYKGIEFE